MRGWITNIEDPYWMPRRAVASSQAAGIGAAGYISYRLGRSLEFDPETLTFPHEAEANSMLTREYRVPYVLPDFPGLDG